MCGMTLPTFYTFVRLVGGCGVQKLASLFLPTTVIALFTTSPSVCSYAAAAVPPRGAGPLANSCGRRCGPLDYMRPVSCRRVDRPVGFHQWTWIRGREEGREVTCTISRAAFGPPLASALLQTRHMPGSAGRLCVDRYVQPAKRLSHAAFVPHALRADGEGGSGRFRTESYSSPSRMCRFRLALPCLPMLPSPPFASSNPPINAPHFQNPPA